MPDPWSPDNGRRHRRRVRGISGHPGQCILQCDATAGPHHACNHPALCDAGGLAARHPASFSAADKRARAVTRDVHAALITISASRRRPLTAAVFTLVVVKYQPVQPDIGIEYQPQRHGRQPDLVTTGLCDFQVMSRKPISSPADRQVLRARNEMRGPWRIIFAVAGQVPRLFGCLQVLHFPFPASRRRRWYGCNRCPIAIVQHEGTDAAVQSTLWVEHEVLRSKSMRHSFPV